LKKYAKSALIKSIMSYNRFIAIAELPHSALFGPQFSFVQHFEQRNCSLPRFLYDTQFLTIPFKWLHVFVQ